MENDQNHIIATLSPSDRALFLTQCRLINLEAGQDISSNNIKQIYFPLSALISVLAPGDSTQNVEVEMIGREGMYGIPFLLGLTTTSFPASVLYSGQAWCITATALQTELNQNKSLQSAINRYINVVIEQLYSACRCIKFHTVHERLAKWLLMSQDRSNAVELRITQETLASLLGVRRVGITDAAIKMRNKGIIEYSRGHMRIMDRENLEKEACACYANEKKMRSHFTHTVKDFTETSSIC